MLMQKDNNKKTKKFMGLKFCSFIGRFQVTLWQWKGETWKMNFPTPQEQTSWLHKYDCFRKLAYVWFSHSPHIQNEHLNVSGVSCIVFEKGKCSKMVLKDPFSYWKLISRKMDATQNAGIGVNEVRRTVVLFSVILEWVCVCLLFLLFAFVT